MSFIYDILSHIISNFLRYPASHSLVETSLPSALRSRLTGLGLVHAIDTSNMAVPHSDAIEWSESEIIIRNIFSRMSNTNEDKISRHTTIFQLGLDSINAVQVAARLQNKGFANITATNILENPTCAKLAIKMAERTTGGADVVPYDLTAFKQTAMAMLQDAGKDWNSIETVLPCTSLQTGMLTEFINSQGRDYLNFIRFRVDSGITASALKDAWVALVKASPILRTGFTPLDHEDASFAMIQYIYMEDAVPVYNVDRLNFSAWKQRATRAIFDDLRRPPWQVVVVGGSTGVEMYLAIHHVLYDAQSLHMLMGGLGKLLDGGTSLSDAGPQTAVQDIITQTQRCKKDAETFWKKQAAVVNKFPVMTPLRQDTRDILIKSLTSSLSFPALEQAVKNAGFTIQAVAQAAWSRILSSYVGEQSVVFGTIFSGRTSEATREAMFPCISTLPIIANCSSSNRALIKAMMQYNTDLQRHQRTPLTDIQRWLGHANLKMFDTLLVYQKYELAAETLNPWRIIDEVATVDYPVSVEIEPQGDLVELRITFFSDILPVEQAEILLQQFDAIFCDLAQNPDGSDDALHILHPEQFAILPAEDPEIKSEISFLHEFVQVSAEEYPTKTALDFVSGFKDDQPISRSWTYRELDECGNKVANMLSAHVEAGDIVAVCFEKCPEAHFSMLGILKAGCALLALDPGAPASRKQFILQDAGAAVLLTDKLRSVEMDFKVSVPIVVIDEDALTKASSVPPKLTRPLTPEDRSYCLYTSGTTGTPKGCEITHENAVQAMLAFQQLFAGHWDQDSKWLQFASYHFDVSVLEQFWTWSVGIVLVAVPRDVILEDLSGTISRLAITHIDLTPSLARLVHPNDVPSLCRGVFITGGEQLKQEILDVWGPKRVIHNFYGPTEATIGVTTYPCVPINGRSSNIGRQFANVGAYVLHPGTDVPVLRGGVGELCVSGKLVGKGYLHRDELTAERFPTLQTFGERVYRTGDLVRVLYDGCFDFLGRADDQVKLRGQRLEIGEVNQCVREGVGEVTDVATLVVRNEKQQKDLLVSFVVTTQDQTATELHVIGGDEAVRISRKVQQACRDRLPGYMVPTYVLLLPVLPLSSNNKAEVKELKALFNRLSPQELVVPSVQSTIAFGDMGRRVCKALATMTDVVEENISPASNIFELGVDSITVLRLVRALKRGGVEHAGTAVILRNPIIADLARALQTSQNTARASSGLLEAKQTVEACQHRHKGLVYRMLGVTPDEIEYIAPCSALQQGMISRSRSEGNEGAYFNTFRYKLAESVSLAKLRLAWEGLVRDSSILRTRFVSTVEGHVQAALKHVNLPWDEVILKDGGDCETWLDHRRKAWIDKNSQTLKVPLELLVVAAAGKRLLVVHIFHGIYDASSFDLMLHEISRRSQDVEKSQDAPSFLDALLHGPLRNHDFCKSFWVEHLEGTSLRALPRLSERTSDQDVSVSRRVPFDGLEKLRRTLGTTQQAIIQALWSIVLERYVTTSVTIGIVVSGRSIELDNVDKTIGPLFNTIPYHHRTTQAQTWSSSIRQCHEVNTAVLDFQHVPLRDVQRWCAGGRPLFDTLFSFQRGASTDEVVPLWTEVASNANPDYPLAFEATLIPDGGLQVVLVAQKGFADAQVLEGILDKFEEIARTMVDDPDSLVYSGIPNGIVADEQDENLTAIQTILPADELSSFEWTTQGEAIRRQVSLLANVEETSITPNTSLLELGLDSIDTIKLSARLKRAGIVLSNSQLIKGQTIAHFLEMLQERNVAKGGAHDSGCTLDEGDSSGLLERHLAETGLDLTNIDRVLAPTPLQDSLVSEMIHSDFERYFNHDVLELSPQVNLERLKSAWTTVIEHSPILRTSFAEVASPNFDFAYAQLVAKRQPPFFDNTGIDSFDEVSLVLERARQKACEAHGLSDLLQITFAKSRRKVYVVLSIAHALYDGWSLELLHQDVEAAYHGTYSPRDDYTEYLRTILSAPRAEGEAFWYDYMSDAQPTLFPCRDKRAASNVHRAEGRPSTAASTLKAFCKRHAISQQAVAQACWAAVLATHCQRLDVTFGVVLSGRDSEVSEAILFPTMNTVPVRAVFHGSVSGFLRYVQENMTSISQFQHFPLRKIQALVKNGQGSLFNTLFILQKSNRDASSSNAPLMASVEGSSSVEYPVCVEMEVDGDHVIWRTACDDSYLSRHGTDSLLGELETVLAFLVNSTDEAVIVFGEEGVSVCGLPAFQPMEQANEPNELNERDDADESWSSTEELIRSVLAEFSGVEPVSINKSHSLYHLGLDSISAIKVSSALRKHGVTIAVRDMIQSVSIKEMARKVAESGPSTLQMMAVKDPSKAMAEALQGVELVSRGIDAGEIQETLPANAMQTHMLSVWQNSKGSVFFPEFCYRLFGVSGRGAIDVAWRSLVEQQPILRTVFSATGSSTLPLVQMILRPGATTDNPFVRFKVQCQGDGSWLIRLRLHHALYDGVSLPLLMDCFMQLLRGEKVSGEYVNQLSSWKRLLASSLGEAAVARRAAFWQGYLQGATQTPLEIRDAGAATTDARVGLLRRAAVESTTSLRSLCAIHGISLQAVFLAAYAKVLATLSGESNERAVVFGVYLATRDANPTLPYPTLCLVPLRVNIPRTFQLVDVAAAVQRDLQLVSDPAHVGVGLWEVKAWTGMVVDSFVNFLRLPEGEGRAAPENGVRLHEADMGDQEVAMGNEGVLVDPDQLCGLERNAAQDAYQVSPCLELIEERERERDRQSADII